MNDLVKQENGKKVQNIEISVDTCAQLGGQVYNVVNALRDVYLLSGLRNLTYVDTFQGFREKSDGTTPETLFAFGRPHTDYGRFIYDNRDWQQITETHECKQFSDTLGGKILPTMTAPVIEAIEEISQKIREDVFIALQRRQLKCLAGKNISQPSDVEIPVSMQPSKWNAEIKIERYRITEPLIEEAVDQVMGDWKKIVAKNPILNQSKENNKKGMLIDLIAATQESKAIAAALLYHHNPEEAKSMGVLPELITKSTDVPSLAELRASAHQFGHLIIPKSNDIWQMPEVQQAIRYTGLWPWARKPYMHDTEKNMLEAAHKNTADRAAVSYFLNHLSQRENGADTLYVLVTHDGPLITDFVHFISGIERQPPKALSSRQKREGKKKEATYRILTPEEFEKRHLLPIGPSSQPYNAILTGSEFVTFVKREQKRVQKKIPMTHELNQAMETLSNALDLLEEAVKRDMQAYGLRKDGLFANRMRRQAEHDPRRAPER